MNDMIVVGAGSKPALWLDGINMRAGEQTTFVKEPAPMESAR